MDNRFRRMPPRIEPRYVTHVVSKPPPLPEVEETSWLTPAGEVAGFERLASAVARNSDRTGSEPVRQRRRGKALVILYIALSLGTIAVGFVLRAVVR
ncbi:hypothetical protein ACFT9M_12600 [Micromonospora purpureochromogenes]|uniref:hypothetical protein n=1 Tax=Micromonospora purpureochromogenes TaxID=47872 RepID=UPI00362FCAE8